MGKYIPLTSFSYGHVLKENFAKTPFLLQFDIQKFPNTRKCHWHFISDNFDTNDVFGGGQVSEGSQHDIIDFVISSCP